jgi:hypothetical protein
MVRIAQSSSYGTTSLNWAGIVRYTQIEPEALWLGVPRLA